MSLVTVFRSCVVFKWLYLKKVILVRIDYIISDKKFLLSEDF